MLTIGLVLVCFFSSFNIVHAQTPENPFGTGAAKSTHVKETPGFLQRTLFELRRVQRQLQKDLADAVDEFKKTSSSKAAFILIGLAFFYGVFHAVGPGHGKIVISSYLVAHESVIRRGILLAFLSSLGQGISAIVLVGIFILILDFSRLATTNFVWTLEQVSYGLMICIGLWMLILAFRRKAHDHHHHGDLTAQTDENAQNRSRWARMAAIVAVISVRPCSGAIILLLFAFAHGLIVIGIGSVVAMSLGTAITVSLLAILSVFSRNFVVRFAASNETLEKRLQVGLLALGAVIIAGFGVLLLLASFEQPAPRF